MTSDLSLDEFVLEARRFLNSHAKPRDDRKFRWGYGSQSVSNFHHYGPGEEDREWAAARSWRRLCFDAGFGWITGPPEFGGRGLPKEFEQTWDRLLASYEAPAGDRFSIGLTYLAPTLLLFGTSQQQTRYLRKLFRADIVACQLFSEPSAGSDLASVQTFAERDGDTWVINGQKVWTTNARYSDIGQLLCRSDRDAPKHAGLTNFILDMRAPGVEVRPLRQATGGSHFNEIFLTGVRVHEDQRLGPLGDGWRVATTTLRNERASIGSARLGLDSPAEPERLIAMSRLFGRATDAVVRQQLADLYARLHVERWTAQRAQVAAEHGREPGPEHSIGKLVITDVLLRLTSTVSNVLGARLGADTGEWGTFAWSEFVVGLPGLRISGGTDEIQRNILAERVLGLPRDPAVDR